jgi:hypothetical protein
MYIKQLDLITSQSVDDYLANQDIFLVLELIKHVEQGKHDASELGWSTKQELYSFKDKIIELIVRKVPYDELDKSVMDIPVSFRARHRLWLKKVRTVFDLIRTNLKDLISLLNADKTLIQEIYNHRISILNSYLQILESDSSQTFSSQATELSVSEVPLPLETPSQVLSDTVELSSSQFLKTIV